MATQDVLLVDSASGDSAEFTTEANCWYQLRMDVATTFAESRRFFINFGPSREIVKVVRSGAALTLKYKTKAADFAIYTSNGSDDLNCVFAVTAGSLVNFALVSTGKSEL